MASASIGGYAEKCSINEVTFVPRATYSLPSGRRKRLPSLWEQMWPFDLWRETAIDRWYRDTEKDKEKKKHYLLNVLTSLPRAVEGSTRRSCREPPLWMRSLKCSDPMLKHTGPSQDLGLNSRGWRSVSPLGDNLARGRGAGRNCFIISALPR